MYRSLVVTTLLLVLALPASAEIEQITVKVDGLACAFCVYGLEKSLKRVDGVGEVKVFLDEGRAELRPQADKPVDLAAIAPAIRQSGYTPREITLKATGKYQEWNGRPTLVVDTSGTRLFLDGTDMVRKLTEAITTAGKDRNVSVLGKLKQEQPAGHHGHPQTLLIESFQVQ